MDLAFAYLRERDIDILMVEELSVNPEFVAWYCAEIDPRLVLARAVSVNQSLNTKYDGETDIQLIVECDEGRVGILIEQKIAAPPQPNQAERYRTRGEIGVSKGLWTRFITCLSAPQQYIDRRFEAARYDARVSYERLLGFFAGRDDVRFAFKAAMIREAIKQNRRGPKIETHDASTEFFTRYYKLAMAEAPDLTPDMPRNRPSGSHWMVFRPTSLPSTVLIRHAMPQRRVCLYIKATGDAVLETAARIRPLLAPDMRLSWVKASVTIDVETPELLPQAENREFDSVIEELRFSIHQAQRLKGLYERFAALESAAV